jgi:hypothetical protein
MDSSCSGKLEIVSNVFTGSYKDTRQNTLEGNAKLEATSEAPKQFQMHTVTVIPNHASNSRVTINERKKNKLMQR